MMTNLTADQITALIKDHADHELMEASLMLTLNKRTAESVALEIVKFLYSQGSTNVKIEQVGQSWTKVQVKFSFDGTVKTCKRALNVLRPWM